MKRGQATVELALGSIVFVTILLFGIHFAEAGWLSIKVQEATHFALFEATGPRVQRLAPFFDAQPFDNTVGNGNGVADRAEQRYRDFDGVGPNGNGARWQSAITRGDTLRVNCAEVQANGPNGFGFAPSQTLVGTYQNRGGIQCGSQAMFEPIGIPVRFLEQSEQGFFNAQHRDVGARRYCGVGPMVGGACPGRIGILTNDWGLAGDPERGHQPFPTEGGCGGGAGVYCNTVQRLWSPQFTAGRQFAQQYAGAPPTDASMFNFAYSGVEEAHLTAVSDHRGGGPYNTGGPGVGLLAGHATVGNRFLGR